MLVQELKALLPDKIISFIIMVMPLQGFHGTDPEWETMSTIAGMPCMEHSAPNVPPLTKAQISPAAV
jgi:hypothetical protein